LKRIFLAALILTVAFAAVINANANGWPDIPDEPPSLPAPGVLDWLRRIFGWNTALQDLVDKVKPDGYPASCPVYCQDCPEKEIKTFWEKDCPTCLSQPESCYKEERCYWSCTSGWDDCAYIDEWGNCISECKERELVCYEYSYEEWCENVLQKLEASGRLNCLMCPLECMTDEPKPVPMTDEPKPVPADGLATFGVLSSDRPFPN